MQIGFIRMRNVLRKIEMERYRIIRGEGYDGCIPTIIYWVQVRKDKRLSSEWVNVKVLIPIGKQESCCIF